jgi:hypothetical protein
MTSTPKIGNVTDSGEDRRSMHWVNRGNRE